MGGAKHEITSDQSLSHHARNNYSDQHRRSDAGKVLADQFLDGKHYAPKRRIKCGRNTRGAPGCDKGFGIKARKKALQFIAYREKYTSLRKDKRDWKGS